MTEYQPHPSQRGYFAYELYRQMEKNEDIRLITADLGYGMFDRIKEEYPDRFLNTGAAEQAAMGSAVGLALSGRIPFVYSITPFLLYRGFETIRNYVDHERIPVRLVGSGRDQDYSHDGFSHHAQDVEGIISQFKNIRQLWPQSKEDLIPMVKMMVEDNRPWFLSLKR